MQMTKNWQDLIDVDFRKSRGVTERTRTTAIKSASRYRGSVRVSLGMFPTDAEYETYRDKILKTKLP